MIRILLPIVLAVPAFAGGAKGRLVVLPLQAEGVSDQIAKGFETQLRNVAAKEAALADRKSTDDALKKAGAKATCAKDDCGAKIAEAAGARFVLGAKVHQADEIYTVEMSLFDSAHKKRQKATGTCELCAAEEVDGTLATTFEEFKKMLATDPPKKEEPPAKPVEPDSGKPLLYVTSEPAGASVLVDGTEVGQTPLEKAAIEPGKHIVVLQKEGYEAEERTISAVGKKVSLSVTLKEAPKAAAPPPVEEPAPPVEEPAAATAPGGDFSAMGWGFAIGGVALAGVGTFLIFLDGEVTCDDGRGQTECPTVYNTKGLGVTGLGIGAALIGSGVTLLVLDTGPESQAEVAPTATGEGAIFRWRGRF